MPGPVHEVIVDLFRSCPRLVEDLLRYTAGPTPPAHDAVRTEDPDAVEISPVARRADIVVLFEEQGRPVLAVVVEPQFSRDEEKRFSWPVYVTNLRARLRCDVVLLVVALDPAVATWAARPIATGHPGFDLVPLVLGRTAVPAIRDPEQARRNPEQAILSALAHGNDEGGLEVVAVALEAASGLDRERAIVYIDVLVEAIQSTTLEVFRAMLSVKTHEFKSEIGKQYVEGMAKNTAKCILAFLDARGLAVSPEERARIQACRDLATLDCWIVRAATASATRELFEEQSVKTHEFKSEIGKKYVEGMAKNTASNILAVLDARGLAVSQEERARIQACRDLATLDCWIVRAATASATRELFEEQ